MSIWGDSTAAAPTREEHRVVEKLRVLADGIHKDIPFAEYLAQDRVSKSLLWTCYDKSPAHARVTKEETKQMALGTAVHCVILEPDEFTTRFVRGPENRRGGRWLRMVEEHGDGLLVEKDYDTCIALRDAIRHNPYVKKLTGAGAYREITACATDPVTGLPTRMRADAYVPGDNILIDLKTTTDARPEFFRRQVRQFGYHMGEAHYKKTWIDAGGETPQAFIHLVVEPEAPFAIKIYDFGPDTFAEGEAIRQKTMERLVPLWGQKDWPGYDEAPEVVEIGKWDYKETVPMGGVE